MDARLTARAIPGKGLAGCANNSRVRQVTLMEREVWQALMKELRVEAPPSARRANLMISGMALADSRGRLLRIGRVLLRIAGETKPCERMNQVHPGLKRSMEAHWCGGAFAEVITGGTMAIGDPVEWADAPRPLPKAMLLDLDDTILNDSGSIDACWREACIAGSAACGIPSDVLFDAIRESGRWFWSDPERHRIGRLDLQTARIEVVRLALAGLGIQSEDLAALIGGTYHNRREARLDIFPDAIDTLNWLRRQGCKLALLTNGNTAPQRRKIETFQLDRFFDEIFIEGELGFGKPDPRVYRLALERLAVEPSDTWMAGDNLEWDVAQPQRLGIYSIWIDSTGDGYRKIGSVKPDRIVRSLSELKHRLRD
jgi:putative hydrolase of the HAD superfamily